MSGVHRPTKIGCQCSGYNTPSKEAGIYLSANEIPEALRDAPQPSRRVTATIETDVRIIAIAERTARSPARENITAVLDLDTMFHWREVTKLSKYHSGNFESLAEDDREQLFTREMRHRWDNVVVAGDVTLEGVDQHDNRIGDRIAGVKGKNISCKSRMNRSTFPQIPAITYDIEGDLDRAGGSHA